LRRKKEIILLASELATYFIFSLPLKTNIFFVLQFGNPASSFQVLQIAIMGIPTQEAGVY